MRRQTFVIVGVLIAALVVAVPVWAYFERGNPQTSERSVPDGLVQSKELFQTNCGACHAMYAGGTDGNFGPDLDAALAPGGPLTDEAAIDGVRQLVLTAIEQGVPPVSVDQPATQPPTRMPAGILAGQQAQEVADFVAQVAGKG